MVFKAVTMGRDTIPTLFLGPKNSLISLVSRRYYESFRSETPDIVAKNNISNEASTNATSLGGL
jgi:hypothetical protein